MDWRGTWINQFGSIVEITAQRNDTIEGTFRTALKDSGFYGQTVPIAGVVKGNCISFACVARGKAGDMVVSYTGLRRDGKMETLWYYAGDTAPGKDGKLAEVPWWKAVIANADTFTRSAD